MAKEKKKNGKPAFAATMQMAGKEATIDVSGVIGWDTKAIEFTSLVAQAKAAGCTGLTVRINSLGGYCSDGLAMGDALESCGMETTGVVVGTAQSMASYLLQCCNRRVAHKNATLMYHQPTAGAWGTVDEVAEQARALVQMRDTMFAKMGARCGMTGEDLSREHLTMKIYTADEALAKGFLDAVDSAEAAPAVETEKAEDEPPAAAHGSMLYDRREMLMAMLGEEEEEEEEEDKESVEVPDDTPEEHEEEKPEEESAPEEEKSEAEDEAPTAEAEDEKPLTRKEVEQMLAKQRINMLASMGAAVGNLPGTCAGGEAAENELTDEQIARLPVMDRLAYLNTRPARRAAYLRN